VAGLFPLTESGLELLLALKPPPPTFGVILLGLGAPEFRRPRCTRFTEEQFFSFILISRSTGTDSTRLVGVILGSSFFSFWVLTEDRVVVCPVSSRQFFLMLVIAFLCSSSAFGATFSSETTACSLLFYWLFNRLLCLDNSFHLFLINNNFFLNLFFLKLASVEVFCAGCFRFCGNDERNFGVNNWP
jgi:hypothetical protein